MRIRFGFRASALCKRKLSGLVSFPAGNTAEVLLAGAVLARAARFSGAGLTWPRAQGLRGRSRCGLAQGGPDARRERRSSRLALSAGPGPERLPPSSCPRRTLQTPGAPRASPPPRRAPGDRGRGSRPDPGIGALDPKQRLSLFSNLGENFAPGDEGRRGDEPLSKVFSGTHFKSFSSGKAQRPGLSLQHGLHRNLSGGCAGFLLQLPPRGPGFPAALLRRTRRRERRRRNPGAGGWGRLGTELPAPFRTVRGPGRSQLLRVWCGDQDRGCWRMRKESPKLFEQSQFQVHSLGWEIDSPKTQRKTNRQFRGEWRQIRSGDKGKTLFLFRLVFEIKEEGGLPDFRRWQERKGLTNGQAAEY